MTVTINVVRGDIDESLFGALVAAGEMACDIETSGLNPKLDRIGTVQIHAAGVGGVIIQVGRRRPDRLCRLIEDQSVRKVFHHAMFDLRFMTAHWNVTPSNVACTKIASKILEPQIENKCHSLQQLLQRRLGVSISKDQRLTDWLTSDLSQEQIRYAAADVEFLLPLLQALEGDMAPAGLLALFQQCLEFIPARVRLELGGWPDVFAY
ncbi:ribonuclease D [Actinoplanes sp. KI2]|uniref:ribonuclease D n=1 Tax=Actinoplanes sp. KI2 TaxID=2983315 RepID=UPI0021D60F4E|nr:ribonuclease D [Actinoplanes sp. KI2]MCU7724563.1 ribonuclease D [Actinoplanes sp. KI2]